MKHKLFVLLVLISIVAVSMLSPSQIVAADSGGEKAGDQTVYLPVVINKYPPITAIVADHRHTDISQIPDEWIAEARKFVIHYAHTSHGSQVLSGLRWLESQDSKYNVDIDVSSTVVLPDDTSAFRVYDGNNKAGDTYIEPGDYWEGNTAMNYTRSTVDTGYFDFSTWTWCGQMSYYSDAQIQEYIDALNTLDQEYPNTRFIYFTGHTDGSAPGSTLWRHNNMVRDYVNANNKILFDFADIESYDPDGTFYPTASDGCAWCDDWCDANPDAFSCQNISISCSHTHPLQCTLKGQAFWYLMARLAGWDGTPAP